MEPEKVMRAINTGPGAFSREDVERALAFAVDLLDLERKKNEAFDEAVRLGMTERVADVLESVRNEASRLEWAARSYAHRAEAAPEVQLMRPAGAVVRACLRLVGALGARPLHHGQTVEMYLSALRAEVAS